MVLFIDKIHMLGTWTQWNDPFTLNVIVEYRIIKAESCAINIDITAELQQPQSAGITSRAYIEAIEVKDKLRVQCTSLRHFSTFNHKITVQSLHVFITVVQVATNSISSQRAQKLALNTEQYSQSMIYVNL